MDRFDKEARCIINEVGKYWKTYEDDPFSMEVFAQKFYNDVPCTPQEVLFYNSVFEDMLKPPNSNLAANMIQQLRTMEFNKAIEEVQTSYTIGEEVDLYESIRKLTEQFKGDIQRSGSDDYCKASIQDIMQDNDNGSALDWKLDCLRRSMPGIRTGMQIIVGLRPGMGKTSFCADNGVHWLQSTFAKESQRPIVWFNNEGKKIRVKGSFVRAALGMDFPEISKKGWDWADRTFNELLGGEDMLRIYDVHGKDSAYIERIIDKDRPFVVFWDMLDNVRHTGNNTANDRQDQKLEALYQWARECAVRYDFLSIPTSQVSVEGAGLQWIPDSCLKDSKTGKQGACDAIITIGTKDKLGFENSRYIYIPKAFKGSPLIGASASCRTQVVFDPSTSRYLNPKKVIQE